MGPVLSMVPSSTAGCDGCSKNNTFIEQFMMYQFVMGLRSEYESVRAQLLNRSPTPPSCLSTAEDVLCSVPGLAVEVSSVIKRCFLLQ